MLAAGAAGAGVLGAWEALAAVERTRLAAAAAARARAARARGREGRAPTAPERRRLGAVAAAALLAAGWLLGGPRSALVAALGRAGRRRRGRARAARRWREELRRAAPACARTMADALGAGPLDPHRDRATPRRPPRAPPAHELGAAARRSSSGEPTEAVLVRLRARARSHAWDTLTAAVLLQRDAGGDLARCCASSPRPARPPTAPSATPARRPPRRASPPGSSSACRSRARS